MRNTEWIDHALVEALTTTTKYVNAGKWSVKLQKWPTMQWRSRKTDTNELSAPNASDPHINDNNKINWKKNIYWN